MSVEDFEDLIISSCSKSGVVLNTTILISKFTWMKIRVSLKDGTFLDVSYNQATGKTAYAHIHDEQRIFGADNKNGWHWHPYADPQRHDFVEQEITFAEFLKKVEENLLK